MIIDDNDAQNPDYCRGFTHGWQEGLKAADASQMDFETALEMTLEKYPACPTCGVHSIPDGSLIDD